MSCGQLLNITYDAGTCVCEIEFTGNFQLNARSLIFWLSSHMALSLFACSSAVVLVTELRFLCTNAIGGSSAEVVKVPMP